MVASRTQRQSKTANTPILVINAYNTTAHIFDEIDSILNDQHILHRYSFKDGYLPNENLLQSLKLFYNSDGFAGLSLNEYLHNLCGEQR